MKFLLLTTLVLLTSPFALADQSMEDEWDYYDDEQEEYGAQEDQDEEDDYHWELLSEEEEVAAEEGDGYYDESSYAYDDEEEEDLSDTTCQNKARPHRIVAKHREGNGIGYPQGYSSLDGFFSYSYGGASHPFFDLRAHVFNDGKFAYNAGLGFRSLVESMKTLIGLNFFYDYRDGRHRQFNQIGAGLEFLGKRWDLRFNGYVPIGSSKKKYFDGFAKFQGNNAIFSKRYEVAMFGFDAGLGGMLAKKKYWDLHAKLGGYYFQGAFGKMFGGGLFELATDITRYITLKGQVSYDNHFKWIAQGEAALNFPLGTHIRKLHTDLCCGSLAELEDRVAESVDRFEMIVTLKHRKNTKALNPLTGQPLFFAFVDNTSHSAGTFESPFPTLLQAQNLPTPADVIYVFPGDGTDRGTNAGIVLQNNQGLIGSAAPLIVTTRFGLRTIPPQTIQTPIISFGSSPASPNPVVTLANNNNVSGFSINANNNGISGSGINGAFIAFNNIFETGSSNCVNIVSPTGHIEIRNNNFTGADGLGVMFQTVAQAPHIFVRDNQFSIFDGCEVSVTPGGSPIVLIDNNAFSPPPNGVSDKAITVLVVGTGAPKIAITNNTITNILNSGSSFGINLDLVIFGTLDVLVSKNTILNVGGPGITVSNDSSGESVTIDLQSNRIANANFLNVPPASGGIELSNTTGSLMLVRLSDNISSSLFGGAGYSLTVNNAFEIQSPNLQISGVEAINAGTFTFPNGTAGIRFLPFTYVPLF